MLAITLALLSSFIDQFSTSVIKKSENNGINSISVWEAGFISLIGSSIFIFIAGATPTLKHFSINHPIVFLIRIFLELIQIYATYKALKHSQLSSFNFVRVFSIVFALFLEIILIGNILTIRNYIGISFIFLGVVSIFNHGVKNIKGLKYLVISAVNGGILNTLAKFQYNTSNTFSIESQVRLALIITIFIILLIKNTNNFSRLKVKFKKNIELLLVFPFRATASLLSVMAINLSSPTNYVALERGGSVVFGVLLGHSVFKEKSLKEKMITTCIILIGIYLLY